MTFNQAMRDVAKGYYVNRGEKIVGCLRNSPGNDIFIYKNTKGIMDGVYIAPFILTVEDLNAKDWEPYEGDE